MMSIIDHLGLVSVQTRHGGRGQESREWKGDLKEGFLHTFSSRLHRVHSS